MNWVVHACKKLSLILVLFAFLAIGGCEGSETREQIDDTVKEFAGKKNIDRMDQMKKDLDKARKQQADRLEKTEESAAEK